MVVYLSEKQVCITLAPGSYLLLVGLRASWDPMQVDRQAGEEFLFSLKTIIMFKDQITLWLVS